MSAHAGPSTLRKPVVSRDDESDLHTLAARLTIQDIEYLESRQRGKQREGTGLTDGELALRIAAEEARSSIIFDNDRAIAQSLHDAEQRLLRATAPNSNGTVRGRAGNAAIPRPVYTQPPRRIGQTPTTTQATQQLQEQTTLTWAGWLKSTFNQIVFGSAPPNLSKPDEPSRQRPSNNCVICRDPIRGVEIRTPCGHFYDKECVTDLFQAATRDESLFPPRCCRQAIPIANVSPHLSASLVSVFKEKSQEFGTLKRVYCANPTCSAFIGPHVESWFGNKFYQCRKPGCHTSTCGRCKSKVDTSLYHSCKPDKETEVVEALGESSGWSRCPGCTTMVELNMGCYHMTCRCKTQFCYLCRAKWKSCRCAQWDQRRLIAAAEERVDVQLAAARRQPVHVPLRPAPAIHQARDRPRTQLPQSANTVRQNVALPRSTPSRNNWTASNDVPAPKTPSAQSSRTVHTPHSFAPTSPTANQTPWRSTVKRMVQAAVNELRVNHDCQHMDWKYRDGGGRCQHCHDDLPRYLFRCSHCQTLACNRCRRNRL